MKKKIFGAFLTVTLFSSILGCCGRGAPSESQDSAVSEIVETTESITTSTPTQTTIDDTTEPTIVSQSDFDFVKTVEQTYICGHQLSYPLIWGQFGEDFSVDPEGAFTQPGSQKISCSVNYKEQYLGSFIFKGCESVDAITDDTEIVNVFIQNEDVYKFDVPKISINGVTLNSNHEALYEALGNNYEIGIDESQINYRSDNLRFHFGFGKFEDTEDKLVSVIIDLKK